MRASEVKFPRLRRPYYINKQTRFVSRRGKPLLDLLLRHVERQAPKDMSPLRFWISKATGGTLTVEATYYPKCLDRSPQSGHAPLMQHPAASVVVHVVPTSVGAAIGGFAGDASPATRLLAQVSDVVITHPNVVNASDILSMSGNTLYVEGGVLDDFFLGRVALRRVNHNVLGVVIEKQPRRYVDYVRYSVDAAHATCGIPIAGYAITRQKIGARVRRFESGAYTGVIENPTTLLEAADRLVAMGATAIAITAEILDLPDVTSYVRGLDANPHGGVEALMSHTVSRWFCLPAAHAPMWGENAPKDDPTYAEYDAREAAELVTTTALGCVLQGLHKAPQPVPWAHRIHSDLTVSDVAALVVPYRSVGNVPALVSEKLKIPILGIMENSTLHEVQPECLNMSHFRSVANYLEAAGHVAAIRAGLAVSSLRRPIRNIGPV